VGLSDKEREVLEQLEKQLVGETKAKAKPEKQVSAVGFARMLVLGSLLMVLGMAVLIFATSTHQVWLGVVAFTIMLAGLYLVSQNWSTKAIKAAKNPPKSKASGENFFQRRWDDRNNRG
jgi:hypothetical protein